MFLFNYRIKRNSIQRQHKLCVDIKVKPNALWMILTRYGNLSSYWESRNLLLTSFVVQFNKVKLLCVDFDASLVDVTCVKVLTLVQTRCT